MNEAAQVTTLDDVDDLDIKTNNSAQGLAARKSAELIEVAPQGGALIETFAAQVDFAKHMATAGFAIAPKLQRNMGACLAVVDLSLRWGFSPFAVARLVYDVKGVMAFESQLVHAVIEKHAPLKHRLRVEYGRLDDEGNWVVDRVAKPDVKRCKVWSTFRGEDVPAEYISPPVSKIEPKNSPLWKTDEDQQLFYFSSARWARRHAPDVMLGIYTRQEMMDAPEDIIDITAEANEQTALHERLANQAGALAETGEPAEGFTETVVEDGLAGRDEPGTGAGDAKAVRAKREKAAKKEPATPRPTAARDASPARASAPSTKAGGKPVAKSTGVKSTGVMPTNPDEYDALVDVWLPTLDDPDKIEERWHAEEGLRTACGVNVVRRNRTRKKIDARLAALCAGDYARPVESKK